MPDTGIHEDIIKQAQDCYSANPVLVLGSGATAPFGIPAMTALAAHLIKHVNADNLGEAEQHVWNSFKTELESGTDLETALHKIQLGDLLSSRVVEQTWALINPADIRVFDESLRDNNYFPLSVLIRRLFDSTHRSLEIVTTNYDRMAEYATELAGHMHYTGFTYGYTRRMEYPQSLKLTRVVNIWKVHGSLDWFKNEYGEVIGLSNGTGINHNLTPVIVTPGIEKYRQTHLEPYRSIIQGADNALTNARAYLCIGYGFNDQHIQEKLVNNCTNNGALVVVLARTLTDSAKAFLLSGKCPNFLAFEKSGNNSRTYSSTLSGPIEIEGAAYWSFDKYLELIM